MITPMTLILGKSARRSTSGILSKKKTKKNPVLERLCSTLRIKRQLFGIVPELVCASRDGTVLVSELILISTGAILLWLWFRSR